MEWYVYILRCADGSLYTGSTTDVERRFVQHCSGKGAKYTRAHPPAAIVYREAAADQSAAFRREAAIKAMKRAQKEALIRKGAQKVMGEMRRKDRELTAEEAWQIVDRSPYGTLTMITEEGPYGVPVNTAREGNTLYFHCAMAGRKTQALRKDGRVCVVFVEDSQIIGEALTTRYGSAMAFGVAEEVTGEGEKWEALRLITCRYAPEHMDAFEASRSALPRTAVWKITVDHITGKANRQES